MARDQLLLGGFNEGWLGFADPVNVVQGKTTLEAVIRGLL